MANVVHPRLLPTLLLNNNILPPGDRVMARPYAASQNFPKLKEQRSRGPAILTDFWMLGILARRMLERLDCARYLEERSCCLAKFCLREVA